MFVAFLVVLSNFEILNNNQKLCIVNLLSILGYNHLYRKVDFWILLAEIWSWLTVGVLKAKFLQAYNIFRLGQFFDQFTRYTNTTIIAINFYCLKIYTLNELVDFGIGVSGVDISIKVFDDKSLEIS